MPKPQIGDVLVDDGGDTFVVWCANPLMVWRCDVLTEARVVSAARRLAPRKKGHRKSVTDGKPLRRDLPRPRA